MHNPPRFTLNHLQCGKFIIIYPVLILISPNLIFKSHDHRANASHNCNKLKDSLEILYSGRNIFYEHGLKDRGQNIEIEYIISAEIQ